MMEKGKKRRRESDFLGSSFSTFIPLALITESVFFAPFFSPPVYSSSVGDKIIGSNYLFHQYQGNTFGNLFRRCLAKKIHFPRRKTRADLDNLGPAPNSKLTEKKKVKFREGKKTTFRTKIVLVPGKGFLIQPPHKTEVGGKLPTQFPFPS